MEDGAILAQLQVNGKPLAPEPVALGHFMTMSGVGAGIPPYEAEHLVRMETRSDPDNWQCVSYPGLRDAIEDEIAPVRRELDTYMKRHGPDAEPFQSLDVAGETPLLGLMMMSAMYSNAFELEMWVDLPL